MSSDLERRFHKEMLGIYREAAKLGDRPSYFLQMVGFAPAPGMSALWGKANARELPSGCLLITSKTHQKRTKSVIF